MSTQDQSTLAEPSEFTKWLDAIDVMRKGSYKDYAKLKMDDQVEALSQQFETWLDSDEWNGATVPALGTPEHKIAKDALTFTFTIMTPPFSSAFAAWVFENKDKVKELLSTEAITTKDYDLLRADLLKEFGEALLDRDPDTKEPRRVSPMFNSDTNNTYLTKNSKGEWLTLTEDDVAKIARDPNGPRIIVTATHAFYESMKDMTPLPEMYENVAKKAAPGIKFTAIDQNPGKGDTLMICGTNTRENNFLNLEDLFRRLHDIESHQTHPWDDDFRHTSQMAVQMNALILKSIVADEEEMKRIQKVESVDGALKRTDANGDPLPTNKAGMPLLYSASKEDPLRLAPNASETIKKIMFAGFSKAGNAFRDGSRLIEAQLKATDAAGKPLVDGNVDAVIGNLAATGGSFNEKEFTYYWHNDALISVKTVKRLLDEKTITREEAATILGNPYYHVPQAMISNKDDTIAPPRSFDASLHDVTYMYSGGRTHADNGHTFKRKYQGVIDSPDLLDYYSTSLAPNTGRAAIAHINYNPEQNSLVLYSGATTDHELFASRIKEFEEVLRKKGLDITIESNGSLGNQRFEIRSNNDFDLFTPAHIMKLEREFQSLDSDSTFGIFVSRAVTGTEMPRLCKAVGRIHYLGGKGEIPTDLPDHAIEMINVGNGLTYGGETGHVRVNAASGAAKSA